MKFYSFFYLFVLLGLFTSHKTVYNLHSSTPDRDLFGIYSNKLKSTLKEVFFNSDLYQKPYEEEDFYEEPYKAETTETTEKPLSSRIHRPNLRARLKVEASEKATTAI